MSGLAEHDVTAELARGAAKGSVGNFLFSGGAGLLFSFTYKHRDPSGSTAHNFINGHLSSLFSRNDYKTMIVNARLSMLTTSKSLYRSDAITNDSTIY